MRVMVIVKATEDSEAGGMPPAELLADMGAFNQALIDAGLFVDAGGVKESRKGARVAFSGKDLGVASVAASPSGGLENCGHALTAADAHGLEAVAQPTPSADDRFLGHSARS